MKKIKVIKFGGTSLRTKEDRNEVIEILKEESKQAKIVVIVSAMGRYPEPYATDTLLKLAPKLSLKETDQLLSCGEIISRHVLCNECIIEGLSCKSLNILENGIKTNRQYGNGTAIFVDTNDLYHALDLYQIVIVPGFFGTNDDHYPTSLGRGGSDLSAILIADSLGLKEVTIYSDVKGIYSADPKVVREAKLYEEVNVIQALLLAKLNVPVLQKKACEMALKRNITMILKSTFNKNGYTIVNKKAAYHTFLVKKENGYFLIDSYNRIKKFDSNLTINQAHRLFV